jgi:hypothetical protein
VDPHLAAIWYVLDGGATIMMPTNTSISVGDGAHTITFHANDTLGNTNSVTRTFTVDTASPVVSITSPADGFLTASTSVNVAFTATDLTKDDTWYTVNGGLPTMIVGSNFNRVLADGIYTIVVSCNDSLGRTSSASIVITIDATAPSIAVSGFAGLSLQQGDVEYLHWALTDAHPASYALHVNGQVVRSGSYSSGNDVGVLIDSTTLGLLNYTMIVQDTFGNVQRHQRLITVLARSDGGIFLHVGVNTHHPASDPSITMTFDMRHWSVLYLSVSIDIVNASSLPPFTNGHVLALPVVFNINLVNTSALRSGSIRVYYNQSLIASQVDENAMGVMRYNPGTSSWVTMTGAMNKSQNYIDISLSTNGIYVIASTPKSNYAPFVLILLIGLVGGIVAVAGYSSYHKKILKVKSKGKASLAYADSISTPPATLPTTNAAEMTPADAKRARLMRASSPNTAAMASIPATVVPRPLEVVDATRKKASNAIEPEVDIMARAESAQKMSAEVSVEVSTQRCVVHKGPITGFSYTCATCGTVYCMKCVRHLSEINESCWSCKQPLNVTSEDVEADDFPSISVSAISPEVQQKLQKLDLSEEIIDEVLESLKSIAPDSRLKYLEDKFPDTDRFDGDF